jgi:uncharacterized protein
LKHLSQKLFPALFFLVLLAGTPVENARAQAVSPADIQTVKTKLNMAVPYFEKTWSLILATRGLHFNPPAVFTYSGTIKTGCGDSKPGDAFYCPADRQIYLDAQFLAGFMKQTAAHTHTDGDYAAIVVAAHEMGHAIHAQLSSAQMSSFNEEQTADCFAGAVTNEARKDGHLDPGDLAEGRYSLLLASDLNLNGALGRMIIQAQPGAHGTADDRILAFNRGYYAGPAACVGELGIATLPPGGRILFEENFQPPPGAQATIKGACSIQPAMGGGSLLADVAFGKADPCNLSVINFGTIPDHVRLEATLRVQRGSSESHVGFFFGPLPSGGFQSYYVAFVQPDGGYGLLDPSTQSWLISSLFRPPLAAKGYDTLNRVTVDIHREQSEATILLYINGKLAGVARPLFGWVDRSQNHNERAGPHLQAGGMQAVFTDFRVIALPEDR